MSTISHDAPGDATTSGSLLTALRATSIGLTVGVLIQAWLGSSGFFEGKPNLINAHEMIANVLFLLGVAQLVAAFMARRKALVGRSAVVISVLSLVSLVAQIGLGYGTRDSVDALVWHLPNGVLLIAINAWLAATVMRQPTIRD